MSKYAGSVAYHLVYAELIQAARYRGLTTYQRIARIGGLPEKGNAMSQATGMILGEIAEQEHREGRPLLSVVCVGASGEVGPGFYVLAESLGLLEKGASEAERLAFVQSEREKVYKAWAAAV